MQVVSSITMMAAEPSIEPACATASKLAGMSSWSGIRIGTDEPPGITAFSGRPPRTPARVVVDELLERRLHRRFVDAGALDVAAHAVELRPRVLLDAEALVPVDAVQDERRHVAEGLDVVDRRRAVVEARDGRERRLDARLRALALERLEERRLLARLGTRPRRGARRCRSRSPCRGCSCPGSRPGRPPRAAARAPAARGRTRRGCRCRRPSRRSRSSRSRSPRRRGAGCAPSARGP